MTIGLLEVDIFIPESHSLKEKRMVLLSLKEKIRNHFNVSIIESANHDKWQRSSLVISNLGLNKSAVNSILSRVVNFLERNPRIQVIDYQLQEI
ncbi:MAG: DUF503 domain-containing protein [Candidatus Omnitrophota bacterium]